MVRSFAAYPRVLEAVDVINIPELDPEAMTSMAKAALIDWILALNGRLSPLEQRIAELEAKVARVEKLPGKWRAEENRWSYMVEKMGIACANELEEELK
jgi:hypothetical protein